MLALVCLIGGFGLLGRAGPHGRTTGIGLLLVGSAAVLGVLRFSGQEQLTLPHMGLSGLAACVGLPCIGAGWASRAFVPGHGDTVRRYVFGVLLVVAAMTWWMAPVRTGLGAAGMLAAAAGAVGLASVDRAAAGMGALGAVLTIVVGLAIGTEGDLLGFPRVGWFHLGLALSHGLLALGILRVDPSTGEMA